MKVENELDHASLLYIEVKVYKAEKIYRKKSIKVLFLVPQGAPTFTRKPQILQKTSDSGDPAIVFDIGFQADRNPEVTHALTEYFPVEKPQ